MASYAPSRVSVTPSPSSSPGYSQLQASNQVLPQGRMGSRAQSLSPASSSLSPVAGVTIEHRMIAELRNQLETQASENRMLRQEIEASTVRQSNSLTSLDPRNTTPPSRYGTIHRSYSDSHVPTQLDIPKISNNQFSAQYNVPAISSRLNIPEFSETVQSILARGRSRSPIQNLPDMGDSILTRRNDRSPLQNVSGTVESIIARGNSKSPNQTTSLHQESATEVLLRKQLSDAQAEIILLKENLRQIETSGEQQKTQFRKAVEELQTRLNETIVGRDSVLELRKRESEGQEKMISKLQLTLKELDTANRQHEKNELEANQRINSLQQAAHSSLTALQQIHSLLLSATRHPQQQPAVVITTSSSPGDLSSSFNCVESFGRTLPPSHVVRLAEETLGGWQGHIRELESALKLTKKELSDTKEDANGKIQSLVKENREKLFHLNEEHDKQIEGLTERATNARQQASGLQVQLADLQEQTTKQTSLQNMELSALKAQYEMLKEETMAQKERSTQKIDELSDELEAYKNNMTAAREEISNLQLKLADANLTIETNKESMAQIQTQLSEEQQRVTDLRSHEGQRLSNIQIELEARSLEVRHLEELLASQKQEAHTQLQQLVFEVQCEEQKKALDKTSQLLAQIESLSAEKDKLSLDVQKKSSECEQSNQNRERLASTLEEITTKLESVQNETENLSKQLDEKTRVVEVLTQERDHYQQRCEDTANELDSASGLRERLQAKLAEVERRCEAIITEKIALAESVESKERNSEDIQREKEQLLKLLEEKSKEVEEVKGLKEDVTRKLKVREKRIQSLEDEVKTLTKAIADKNVEVENVIEGKAGLLEDMRSYQDKATKMKKEREILDSKLQELEENREKTSNQHQLRIQALEHDLQLTLEALRATKSADAKAVDMADGLQQDLLSKRSQVDSLKSAMHGLEETLSASNKERQKLQEENELLQERVSRLEDLLEKLRQKLKSVDKKRSSQRDIALKLESALEKAALKHTDAQQVIEQQQQAIAQLTLKHQLEIKALQRTLATKSSNVKVANNPYSSSSLQPTQQQQPFESTMATFKKIQQQRTESSSALSKMNTSNSGVEQELPKRVTSTHFVQSSSLQAIDGLTRGNYISPVPVVILNNSGQSDIQIPNQNPDPNISLELKDLLQEVKDVFSANVQAMQSANSGSMIVDQYNSDSPLNKSTPVQDQSNFKDEDLMDPPLRTSSPYKLADHEPSQPTTPPPKAKSSIAHRNLDLNGPPSPVTNLLGLHDGVKSDPTLHRNEDWIVSGGVNTGKKTGRTAKIGAEGKNKDAKSNVRRMNTKFNTKSAPNFGVIEPTVDGRNAAVKDTGKTNANSDQISGVKEPTKTRTAPSTKGAVKGTGASSGKSHSKNRHASTSAKMDKNAFHREAANYDSRNALNSDGPSPVISDRLGTYLHGPSQVRHKRSDAKTRQNVKFAMLNDAASRTSAQIISQNSSDVYFDSDSENDIALVRRLHGQDVGDIVNKTTSRSVESRNQRNRDGGNGPLREERVEPLELIISDSDADEVSSVTTVTSVSSDVISDVTKPSSNISSLRERLATLSQMGNQLQKGNKEMAALIKKQDTKLKRCRQEEQQAKRMINSK